MWTRAVWWEGEEQMEGVVPDIWVDEDNNVLYWPQTSNSENAVRERWEPEDDWWAFELIKIKLVTENKRDAEKHGETTDDFHLDDNSVKKRKRKKKVHPDFLTGEGLSHESSSSGTEKGLKRKGTPSDILDKLPPVPSKMTRMNGTGSSTSTSKTKTTSKGGTGSSMSTSKTKTTSNGGIGLQSSKKKKTLKRKEQESSSDSEPDPDPEVVFQLGKGSTGSSTSTSKTKTTSNGGIGLQRSKKKKTLKQTEQESSSDSEPDPDPEVVFQLGKGSTDPEDEEQLPTMRRYGKERDAYPMENGKFQKKVVYLLMDIRKSLKEVLGEIHGESNDEDGNIKKIGTIKELNTYEERLDEAAYFNNQVRLLRKVGGVSTGDTVKNTMQRLISDKVLEKMNMKGKNGKWALGGTCVYTLMVAAIQKSNRRATTADIDMKMKSVMKWAPYRKEGQKKR